MFWFVIELLLLLIVCSEVFIFLETNLKISFVPFKWTVRILVNVSTKSKHSILKCICSLNFG